MALLRALCVGLRPTSSLRYDPAAEKKHIEDLFLHIFRMHPETTSTSDVEALLWSDQRVVLRTV